MSGNGGDGCRLPEDPEKSSTAAETLVAEATIESTTVVAIVVAVAEAAPVKATRAVVIPVVPLTAVSTTATRCEDF
jgi:hypothetical protein